MEFILGVIRRLRIHGVQQTATLERQRQCTQNKLDVADSILEKMNNLRIERRIIDQGVPRFDRRAHVEG